MQPQTLSSDTGGVSMKVVASSFSSIFIVQWFFQAVHLTLQWMEDKLQTYFRRDTGCLNHDTWMRNCKFFLRSFSFIPQGNII